MQLLKKDSHFLMHLSIAIAVIIICLIVGITTLEWLFIITAIFIVLIAEVLNSAIEYTVDLITDDYDILAKYAKDISAFGVLMASVYAVIVGLIVLVPYVF